MSGACTVEVTERQVPLRVLMSAEAQALAWKKRAESLSLAIHDAAACGVSVVCLQTKARRIMAGVE